MTSIPKTSGNGQPKTDSAEDRPGELPVESRITADAADPAPDPFDPESLRLSQDFSASIGVKKVLTTVACRKPNKHEFVRVRIGVDWLLETRIFEDKINRDCYLVDRRLWQELAGDVYPVCLFLAANRQSDVFLWPAKLPGADGRSNTWNDSALAASQLAQHKWIRLSANMGASMYDSFEATGELANPLWPELTFAEILRLCFKDRFIQNTEHPAIRAIRGEV